MSDDGFLNFTVGLAGGLCMAYLLWFFVTNNGVTHMERKAIELEHATYVDGEFTWKKEEER